VTSDSLAFVLIPIALVIALVWGVVASWRRAGMSEASARRAGGLTLAASVAWMAITWLAAASGILTNFEPTPPPFAFVVLGVIVLAVVVSFSPVGTQLSCCVPLWILVAVQGFRLPLELAMHAMYERGVMPIQMSYSGRNFDILTGASSFVVAAVVWSGRGGKRLVAVWNVAGLALLINVVVVAILGTPRFQYFGPDHLNVWVTRPPYVWLPAVMVLAALTGHLLIFRALAKSRVS
jgi:hypothetical protein